MRVAKTSVWKNINIFCQENQKVKKDKKDKPDKKDKKDKKDKSAAEKVWPHGGTKER